MLTIAQIELLARDVPIVTYKREKKGHTKREMDELSRRWKEKKERERQEGKKFNLNDFMRTGKLN